MEFDAIEAEWHPTLNLPLVFNSSLATSRRYWWLGNCEHEWQAPLHKRQQGSKCPYCSNKSVLVGFNDLATTRPAIAAEWHPTNNGNFTPQQVTFGSSKKIWWVGSCGHEWEMALAERTTRGAGCHYCSGHRVLKGFNDFASQSPALLSQWHPTKNTYLPDEVSKKNRKKAWWLGECGHEWDSTILSRVNGAGCPFCSGNSILEGFNDLETLEPAIAAEWHPTKNKALVPSTFGRGSKEKVWWLGSVCGHEWQSSIGDRVFKGTGCHLCSGRIIIWGENDLLTLYPDLEKELHPTKNLPDLDISTERITSTRKIWWIGSICGHEWQSSIGSRTSGHGCIYCGGNRVLQGFNDLESQNPTLAAEWHPTKNGDLKPSEINAKSGKKFWWLGKCGHEWNAQLSNRDNGAGCGICSVKTIVAGINDLATRFPQIAEEWHPAKNKDFHPEQIAATSGQKVWWLCAKGHEWKTSPNTRSDGAGCPFCSGNKVWPGFNDLATINPHIASEWHPAKNGTLTPTEVTYGSKKKIWWQCKLEHEWELLINHRNVLNAGKTSGCPYCCGNKAWKGFNDLATINPVLAAQWHPTKNGDITPHQVTKSSGQKIWWQCDNKHEWFALVSDRSNGSGCPNCANHVSKAEEQIKEYLESLGLIAEGSNRTILGGKKEIDLWIPSHKFGIEFNGIYWHKEKFAGKESHNNKYLAAQKAGIQLIQIWEDDWNQKSELVKNMLAQKLGVAEKVLPKDTDVITVTEQEAEEFLNENHLQGFASGSHYLGLVSNGDIETLRAVMVLEEEPGKTLNIVRYATSATVVNDFKKLLDYATKTFHPESITALTDHCMSDGGLYEDNGFIVGTVLPPDYMYVVRNERKPRSEYPLERFRDDSKLLWEEGLTEMELADLNGLDRIWDAGKTRYRFIVGK
jgi:hypothetical protein